MAWEDRPYYREGASYGSGRGLGGLRFLLPRTKLGIILIVVNVVVFIIQAATGPAAIFSPLVRWGNLTFNDGRAFYQPWRWITYQYLHGGGSHLFWNLIGIYFFVPVLEQMWGWKKTLLFYTAGGIAAGVTFGLMSLVFPTPGLIGASGSLLAVIGAIAVIAPDMQVLAMMVIPLTMRTLAILYAVLYTFTIVGDRNMSDAAHLGGMAFGAAYVFFGRRFGGVWEQQRYAWTQRSKRRGVQREQDEEANIDRILQKVHDTGMNSLSWSERRILKRATDRQREREDARARRAR
jgi:membrane associated rhomboid family serine protease